MRAGELPHITSDILTRLRARRAARALHHQCGGADVHRERAARGRRHSVDDARRPTRSARSWRAPTRCWSISARSTPSGATRPRPRSRSPAKRACRGCSIRCSSTAPSRAPTYAKSLVAQKPGAIRLNAAEFTALSGAEADDAALSRYALDTLAVVALTGTVDRITDGAQRVAIENGHPLMAQVTAMGCAASALNAAFLAVESDPFAATAAALLCFGVAGGIAGERATGPGSFPAAIIDALYALDEKALTEKARVT